MIVKRLVSLAQSVLTRDFGAHNMTEEHIRPLIPTAIKALQEKLLQTNDAKLELFRTEYTVPISDDEADLTTASGTGLRLDLISRAKIRLSFDGGGKAPLLARQVGSLQRFTGTGIQDKFYALVYLEGNILRIRPKAGDVHEDALVNGINCPQSADNLSQELEGDLVEMIVFLAKQEIREPRRNVDVAQRKVANNG
jgi:hypothetical protein